MLFRKPKNALEGHGKPIKENLKPELTVSCNKCKKMLSNDELETQLQVCPYCRYHFKMNARQRIDMIIDSGSFVETAGHTGNSSSAVDRRGVFRTAGHHFSGVSRRADPESHAVRAAGDRAEAFFVREAGA